MSGSRAAALLTAATVLLSLVAPRASADPTTTTAAPSTTAVAPTTVAPTTTTAPAPTTTTPLGSPNTEPPPAPSTLPVPAPLDLVPVGALIDGRDRRGHVLGASDALANVPLGAEGLGVIATASDQAEAELAARRRRLADHDRQVADLAAEQAELTARGAKIRSDRDATTTRIASVRHDLRSIAVARFTSDGPTLAGLEAMVDRVPRDERRVTSTLAAGAIATSSDRLDELQRRVTTLDRESEDTAEDLQATETRRTALVADRPRLEREVAEQATRAAAAESTMGSGRAAANVAGSDMGLVALDAYWRAAKAMTMLDADCRLDWWGLAGVGRSESHHGRYKGGAPALDGSMTVPVIGIPLDGSNHTRVIRDTDKGLLDGDTVYDRAVGPMQFIPGTWKRWGADGNGDGRVDPQNFYDMALAAARLLCSGGGALDTDEGLLAAYLRYNRDPEYMRKVLAWARAYELLPVPSVMPPSVVLPTPGA